MEINNSWAPVGSQKRHVWLLHSVFSSLIRKPNLSLLQLIQIVINTVHLEETNIFLENFISGKTAFFGFLKISHFPSITELTGAGQDATHVARLQARSMFKDIRAEAEEYIYRKLVRSDFKLSNMWLTDVIVVGEPNEWILRTGVIRLDVEWTPRSAILMLVGNANVPCSFINFPQVSQAPGWWTLLPSSSLYLRVSPIFPLDWRGWPACPVVSTWPSPSWASWWTRMSRPSQVEHCSRWTSTLSSARCSPVLSPSLEWKRVSLSCVFLIWGQFIEVYNIQNMDSFKRFV